MRRTPWPRCIAIHQIVDGIAVMRKSAACVGNCGSYCGMLDQSIERSCVLLAHIQRWRERTACQAWGYAAASLRVCRCAGKASLSLVGHGPDRWNRQCAISARPAARQAPPPVTGEGGEARTLDAVPAGPGPRWSRRRLRRMIVQVDTVSSGLQTKPLIPRPRHRRTTPWPSGLNQRSSRVAGQGPSGM